ncbi:DinB family protein [Antarcticibacterium flavum]|uniref:DinB family protein n=1 Tax=Antarcticibacterium flavum TaxID=2058175 RepID=A0A5B7X4M5_9FLAO|nr:MULTISPECIES: DinB family protein [Antarcticibacterium]MCM4158543.1 hypothetical protein [Antarcticibacterium sp. W02-3]QCY70289.1 DinB family protein [Antarcticibacterium flavum]
MKIRTDLLLEELSEKTRTNLDAGREFLKKDLDILNNRPGEKKWSPLECLEHLNLYGDFYLPEIERAIATSKYQPEDVFKSGILGNYFAKMMMPQEKLRKIKTFKDKDPIGSDLSREAVNRFVKQQEQLLDLLCGASQVSLTRTKTGISISKLIRLRLGDTFRVVIYHNERHVIQAQKAMPDPQDQPVAY